ncbi:hypothetical protein GCM10027614_82630 [Micromonospora vulcania]
MVYKPRSLTVETHFYALVDWLNDKGLANPLRRMVVVERPQYGWVEFVPVDGCADEDGVRRFFWRQGAYLGLLYLLRASDIHLENVIAAGEQPVIVDLEATFQQTRPTVRDRPLALPAEALRLAEESVLSIGLLPQRIMRHEGDDVLAMELSGLAGGTGDLTPMKVPRWDGTGTDEMRRARDRVEMPAAQNLPRLNGTPADPTRHHDDLIEGFTSCYQLLLAHRDELAAPGGPVAAFATDEIRFIVLPTVTYARILQESWHPAVLGDALDRECLFEILATRHPDLVADGPVAASEIRQLARRDIPFFWTRPDSRDLHDDHGVVAADFFPASGLELVRDRIAGLSAADLRRQTWAVSASLASLQIGDRQRDPRPRTRALPAEEIDQALAERAAVRLGDHLLGTAVGDPAQRPLWLTLALVADRYWSVVPTTFESFSGLCGIAVFLGQLGEQTNLTRFRSTARAIAATLGEHVDALLGWPEADRDALGIGGFSEVGGYVHTDPPGRPVAIANHAGPGTPTRTRAGSAVRERPAPRCGDRNGRRGPALRALHTVDPSDRTLAALDAAGDRLLAAATTTEHGLGWRTVLEARSPLLGYSHGTSGIAHALAEIGRATGKQRFLDAAAQAVRHEHHQYDAVAGNWPDHRTSTPRDRS